MEFYPELQGLLYELQQNANKGRDSAERKIKELKNANIQKYVASCLMEVMRGENNEYAKQMATILFKNELLKSNFEDLSQNIWYMMGNKTRADIKKALLDLLVIENLADIKNAAQCIAAIATIEVPNNEWLDLIDSLCLNAQSEHLFTRQAALLTLGYLSEDLKPQYIPPDKMNDILYAVLTNITTENLELTQVSLLAFSRAAPYIRRNFEVQEQKEFIMKYLMIAAAINNSTILETLMKALIDVGKIASDFIVDCFDSLGDMTLHFINSEYESVAILNIEFWTTIFDVEFKRLKSSGFSTPSILHGLEDKLLKILFTGISKMNPQSKNVESDEDWNLGFASTASLERFANLLKDQILETTLSFALPKVTSSNWVDRYVGNIVLGAIMDGPTPKNYLNYINGHIGTIVQLIQDPIPKVKHSVSWFIYRLACLCPEILFSSQESLDSIVNLCLNSIDNSCLQTKLILYGSLAVMFKIANQHNLAHMLNPHFAAIFTKVMGTFSDPEVIQSNNQQNVSNYMTDFVEFCDTDSNQDGIAEILNATLQQIVLIVTNSRGSISQQDETQLFLFSGLAQVCLGKMKSSFMNQQSADALSELILQIGSIKNSSCIFSSLYIINGFINCIKEGFDQYFDVLMNFVIQSFQQCKPEDDDQIRIIVGILTDASNYTPQKLDQIISRIYTYLLQILSSDQFNIELKIVTISNIGDIMMNLKTFNSQFFLNALESLNKAALIAFQYDANNQDIDTLNSLRQLREALFSAYFSILHAVEDWFATQQISRMDAQNYCNNILTYSDEIFKNQQLADDLTENSKAIALETLADSLIQEHTGVYYEGYLKRGSPLVNNVLKYQQYLRDDDLKRQLLKSLQGRGFLV